MKKLLSFILVSLLSLSMLFSKEKFALVLSGGGARGISHVAILKELDRRGIVPDMILGTSMGALVGAFYASGWSGEEIESLLLSTDLMDLIIRLDNEAEDVFIEGDSELKSNIIVTGFGKNGLGASNGLLNDQALSGFIRKHLAKVLDVDDFDKLSIQFRAIGTDIVNSKEIVFSSGSLYKAMRSSMSLPLVFSPVKLDERVYVMDGGMVNNLPVNIAKDMGADIVLAVDVNDAKHQNGLGSRDYDTLTGAFSAFSNVITLVNSVPNYELADLVIVPNVNEFSTIAFDKTKEILERGEEAVSDNMDFFDLLEARLKSDEKRVSYSELPASEIKEIDYSAIEGYNERFAAFIGKPIDETTITSFEKLLEEIRSSERIKRIEYEIKDGRITLETEYYKSMEGVVALGAVGALGISYDGYNKPFFFISPKLSAEVQYRLAPRSLFSFAIIYNDSLKLETRYSTPLPKSRGQYFIGLDFALGNLTMLSTSTIAGHVSKEDTSIGFMTGFFYKKLTRFRIDSFVGVDYIHPARLKNPNSGEVIIDCMNLLYAYAKTSFTYNARDWKETLANGFDISSSFSVGVDFNLEAASKTRLGYDGEFSFYGEFGPDDVKSITSFNMVTKRRSGMLKNAYVSTKTSTLSRDYLYLSEGARIKVLGSRFYLDVSAFGELKEKYKGDAASLYYDDVPSLVPFSTISAYAAGVSLSIGYNTSLGHLFLGTYLAYGDRFTVTIEAGIR